MTNPETGLGGLREELIAARAALNEFSEGPARQAANELGVSFERAGARISRALGRAAADGEGAFKRLTKSILEEFAKVALERLMPSSKTPFFGARAGGGAVNAGGAYLVGERGPELFVPRQGGTIGAPGGSVEVHFHLNAAAEVSAITRHQGQIAAAVARAVAYGRRNL